VTTDNNTSLCAKNDDRVRIGPLEASALGSNTPAKVRRDHGRYTCWQWNV